MVLNVKVSGTLQLQVATGPPPVRQAQKFSTHLPWTHKLTQDSPWRITLLLVSRELSHFTLTSKTLEK